MVTALLEAFFNSRRKPPLKNPKYALANLWKTSVESGLQVLTRMTRPGFNAVEDSPKINTPGNMDQFQCCGRYNLETWTNFNAVEDKTWKHGFASQAIPI